MRGNCITFCQDLEELATELPRLPQDLNYVILQNRDAKKKEFKIRPKCLVEALQYLKDNNPYYADVNINMDNVQYYEDREGTIHDIPTINYAYEPKPQDQLLDKEMPMDAKKQCEEDGFDWPIADSIVPNMVPSATIKTLIEKSIQGTKKTTTTSTDDQPNEQASTDDQPNEQASTDDQPNEQEVPDEIKFAWPKRAALPLSETEPGYFSKAFPDLFPDGKGDITVKTRPGPRPYTMEWTKHCLNFYDGTMMFHFICAPITLLSFISLGRFRKHDTFMMVVGNMLQRQKLLQAGNMVCQDEKVQNMTANELKSMLGKVDTDPEAKKIISSLRYFSNHVPGSNQYFYNKLMETKSFAEHLRIRSDDTEMLNLFHTFSMADMYWDDLHQLLDGSERYLGKHVVDHEGLIPEDNADMYITEKQNHEWRAKNLNDNAILCVDYFCDRTEGFITKVLPKTIGVKEYFIRNEFQGLTYI